MPKFFVVAGAVALSGIIAGALTIPRGPAPATSATPSTSETPAPAVAEDEFEQRWDTERTKKQDRLAVHQHAPEPQAEIRVVPDPVVETMVAPAAERIDKKDETPPPRRDVPHRYASAGGDICERNHMHKVWFTRHHWKVWRCR